MQLNKLWFKSHSWFCFLHSQELNKELFAPDSRSADSETSESDGTVNRDELIPENLRGSATAVWNTVKDLHLELILMYHRVCLKLETMGADPAASLPKPFKRRTCSRMQFVSLPLDFIPHIYTPHKQ